MKHSKYLDFIETGYCLTRRIIYIDEIKETAINKWIRIFTLLEFMSKEPITIYLNSPGGSVYDGLALFDVIRDSKCRIKTIGMGKIMSMGIILFCAGDKREVKENTTFMAHQISSMTMGTLRDMMIDTEECKRLNEIMLKILGNYTDKNTDWWRDFILRGDQYFDKDFAKAIGVIK